MVNLNGSQGGMSFKGRVLFARDQMRELFPTTPLQLNNYLSQLYNAEIYLKREDLSPVRSYKIRGAFNAIRISLRDSPKVKNFVCASAGNHAQGMAYCCEYFNLKGVIFMPVTTPQQKISRTKSFGGKNVEIRLFGDYFDQTLKAAVEFSELNEGVFIPPFDNENVIEGQATVMSEVVDQMPGRTKPDLVLLAVGGGGLAAGMVKFAKLSSIKSKFIFTEPKGAASFYATLSKGKLVKLRKTDNFVDGASVAEIGRLNFKILKVFQPSDIKIIEEDRVCATMIDMLNNEGIVLEPAGALAIDALKDIPSNMLKGKKVVCIVSGGNFDFERLPDVKERALRVTGLKKYVILRLPQRPGALKDFLNLLGPNDDISRFEYLKKSARNFGSVLIGIETTIPENFKDLFSRMTKKGFTFEDITENQALKEFVI